MIERRKKILLGMVVVLLGLASACQPQATPISPTPEQIEPSEMPTLPPPEPTVPPRSLVICLGQEPDTLYPYAGNSRSMWSVLEAVYDGPFDTRQFSSQPVILSKMPSLNEGDAFYQPVDVQLSTEIVDADGNLVGLSQGTRVLPSGCHESSCAIEWNGSDPLQIDQLVVNFDIFPGLTWSDGSPLNAQDTVFSFEIAADPATPISKFNIYRTQSYEALSETQIQWTGKPGYFPVRYETLFWIPLPRHQLETMDAKTLLSADEVNRQPLGWGPYIMEEWVAGDHIQLKKNPNYFRANEGLPVFDTLVYRFFGPSCRWKY